MNKENLTKKSNYEKLFKKSTKALKNEFYFEATWISYSIIEDRLVSAIKKCGGEVSIHTHPVGKPIKMLGPKISEIKSRMPNETGLRGIFYDSLLNELSTWSKDRNVLMHALAEETDPIEDLDEKIKTTATRGQELSKELAARIRRLKKQLKK